MRFVMSVAMMLTTLFVAAAPAHAAGFTFEGWFKGRSRAVGSFSAINGVKRSFTVDLHGKWDGKRLTLREDFVYNDGERDRKTWIFTKTGPNTYSGTREDVVGATKVTITGNVARFSYQVYLDPKNKANLVRFRDVMTLRPDGTIINEARIYKFGLPVGKTRVEFTR